MNLAEQLENAEVVQYDPISKLTFVWNGGGCTGIHGYTPEGREVAYWQIDSAPTMRNIRASIRRHIKEQEFPA